MLYCDDVNLREPCQEVKCPTIKWWPDRPTACIALAYQWNQNSSLLDEGIWILNCWKSRKRFLHIFGTTILPSKLRIKIHSQKVLKQYCKLLSVVYVNCWIQSLCTFTYCLSVNSLPTFTLTHPCSTSRNLLFQDIFVYSDNRSLFLSKDFVCVVTIWAAKSTY